jgi:uncharacterized protein
MTTRHRSLQAAGAPTVTGDGRTVTVRLVAWDHPSTVTDDGGRTWYHEQFARGGLQAPPDVADVILPASAEHHAEKVGRIIATDDRPDGLYAEVRMADTVKARDQLALIDEGLLSVSVEFDDDPTPAGHGDHVTRTAAVLTGLAFTDLPQHTSAAVIGRRSHKDTTSMDNDSTDHTAEPTAPAAAVPTTEPATEPATTEHTRSMPATRPDPTPAHRQPAPATAPALGSRFRSFGEFVRAAATGDINRTERETFYRALAAADTSDTAGLIRVQWLSEIIDLIQPAMPTVAAFSQRPLPDKGLVVSQPTVTTRPTAAKQAAQLDAISSTAAVIGSTSWDVFTFGGGQAMSLQTILRTEPEYLTEVMRLHAVEMALAIETAVVAAVLAAADDVHTAVELSNTAVDYQDAFVDAAALVLGAAGIQQLPSVAVLNVPMWVKLAKAKDTTGRPLFPSMSPTNPQGTLELTSASGEIRSLRYFVSPKMATTNAKAVVGVPEAFRTMLGPVQTLQADVPETLSQEHAIYQFAAYGKVDARGLVLIQDAS